MAKILLGLGWLGILAGIGAIVFAFLPSTPSMLLGPIVGIGVLAIMNGALVAGFAQLIEGMHRLNVQIEPLAKIGAVLAPRYLAAEAGAPAPAGAASDDPEALDAVVANPPTNAQVYANGNFRVVLMSDGRVIAQTAEGTRSFANLDAYKKFAGLG